MILEGMDRTCNWLGSLLPSLFKFETKYNLSEREIYTHAINDSMYDIGAD